MKVVFSEKLLKSIPKERYFKVLNEIKNFYEEYIDTKFNIRNMKNGWSVRQISGTTNIQEIYKFRVNIKDRVLFTYGKHLGLRDEFLNSIVFLEFCNHDNQIIRGRNFNSNEYIEHEFDEKIDNTYYTYKYEVNEGISRIVSIDDLTNMIEDNDEKALYYLNDEQFKLISSDIKPLFLFGSAGSGKTTISINKAYLLAKNQLNVGYFTYSDNLVDESKKIFEKIYKNDELIENLNYEIDVAFNCLNDYIMRKSKKMSIINYEQFKIWIDNIISKNINNKFNLQSIDIFREIRGIIKGIVPIDWMPIQINIDILSDEFVEYLLENEYAYIIDNILNIYNKCLADLNTNISNNVKLNKEMFSKELDIIYKTIDDYIFEHKMIDKDIYLNLPKKYSIYTHDEKIIIYDIAQRYQKWLESSNKFDENDITRIALNKLKNENKYKLDYIICDEIQDLTELQIYYLMKLVIDKNNILFCGDYNQTINPTFFNTGRVEAIYKIYNGLSNFKDSIISKNYRSPKKIVEFANKLTNLKIDTLGKSGKNDYFENATRESLGNIRIIKNNIRKSELLSIIKKRAYVDIIVADECEKEKLMNSSEDSNLVFTVSEYKGLENEYIIGYNILSKFKEKWNDILKNNTKGNEIELRYYFNLFYVFVTRSRNNVLLIEDDINDELIRYFSNEIDIIYEFDYKKLELDRISTKDEHYKKARLLEKNKQYIKAIQSYKNADLSDIELNIEITRCNALQKILEGNYKQAADELCNIYEYKYALDAYLKCEDYLNVIKCAVKSKMKFLDIKNTLSFADLDIVDYVRKQKNNIDWYESFEKIYINYIENEFNFFSENVESIRCEIDKIIKINN